MLHSRIVLPALLLVSAACAATARESWLAASDWEPRPGEEVAVTSAAGDDFAGDGTPFASSRIKRLIVRQAETRDLEPVSFGSPRFVVEDGRGALVAYETEPATVTFDGAEFDARLEDAGLEGPARMRLASGATLQGRAARERSALCAKMWIGGADGRRIKEPVGLPLELVARRDPVRVSALKLQVLFRGRPLSGALVKSWMQPLQADGSPVDPARRLGLPATQKLRTDARGMVRLDVSKRGEYLVATTHAVPCRDPHAADWDGWQATLSFARGADRPWSSTEPVRLSGTGLGHSSDLGDAGFGWSTSLRDQPGWGRNR